MAWLSALVLQLLVIVAASRKKKGARIHKATMVDAGSSHTAISFWEWESSTDCIKSTAGSKDATLNRKAAAAAAAMAMAMDQDEKAARRFRCSTRPEGTEEVAWMGGIGDAARHGIEVGGIPGTVVLKRNSSGGSTALDEVSKGAMETAVRQYMEPIIERIQRYLCVCVCVCV